MPTNPGPAAGRAYGKVKRQFLELLATTGNITYSAKAVAIDRRTIYKWQETDPIFAAGMRQAEIEATEALEREAWRRATEGTPVTRANYYRGQLVGEDRRIEYSDTLLLALLRARAPERYRDKLDVNVQQTIKAIAGVRPDEVL